MQVPNILGSGVTGTMAVEQVAKTIAEIQRMGELQCMGRSRLSGGGEFQMDGWEHISVTTG
jgi:hypothetical protein